MTDFGVRGMDALLAQVREGLASMRRDRSSAGTAEDERQGHDEAVDGHVRATVRAGRLESVTAEPGLMRLPAEELCEHIVLAVNGALDDYRLPQPDEEMVGAVDPQALAEQLRDVQERSVRQMSAFGAAMDDVLARMRAARG